MKCKEALHIPVEAAESWIAGQLAPGIVCKTPRWAKERGTPWVNAFELVEENKNRLRSHCRTRPWRGGKHEESMNQRWVWVWCESLKDRGSFVVAPFRSERRISINNTTQKSTQGDDACRNNDAYSSRTKNEKEIGNPPTYTSALTVAML
jgi:hypothetical protein